MTDEIFTSDKRLMDEIKRTCPLVHARYNRDWQVYQLTLDTKNGIPFYDGPQLTEVDRPTHDKPAAIEARQEALETAKQMQQYAEGL
jgi:hypothetical protein